MSYYHESSANSQPLPRMFCITKRSQHYGYRIADRYNDKYFELLKEGSG